MMESGSMKSTADRRCRTMRKNKKHSAGLERGPEGQICGQRRGRPFQSSHTERRSRKN